MSDRTPSNLFKYSLVLTTTLAVIGTSSVADAYNRRATLPSIEVHLEVLQSLRAQAAPQRRAPAQQPANRQQMVAQQQPAILFGRPSKPIAQPAPQVQPAPVQVARQQQPQRQPVQQPVVQQRAVVQQPVVQPAPKPVPQPVFIEPKPQPQVAQATTAPEPKTIDGKSVSQFEPSGEPTIASTRRVPAQQPASVPRSAPAVPAQRPDVKNYATYQPAEASNEPVAPEFTPRMVDMPLRRPVNNPVIEEVAPAADVQVAAQEEAPASEQNAALTALTPVDAPEPEKAAPEPEKRVAQEDTPALTPMEDQAPLPWENEEENEMASLTEMETDVEIEPEIEVEVEPEPKLATLPKPEKITPMVTEIEPEEEMTLAELPSMDEPSVLDEPPVMSEEQAALSLPPLPGMENRKSPLVEKAPEDVAPEPELAEEDMAEEVIVEEPKLVELPPIEEPQEPEVEEEPELVELPQADMVEDEMATLEPLPELEEMPEEDAPAEVEAEAEIDVAVEAESDSEEEMALAPPPPPMKKPVKKEQGMFAGLTAKVASMLGSDDKEEKSAVVEEELKLPPLPEGAKPMNNETAAEEAIDEPQMASLEALDEADESADAELPSLPALPPLQSSDVDEVPVATAPNRALPSLTAIVSEDRREELTQAERREQANAEKAAQAKADAKAEIEAKEKAEAEVEAQALARAKKETLQELPPIEKNVATAKQDEEAPAEEMKMASIDSNAEQKIETAAKEEKLAPEVGYDDANRKQVRLFYGRDDTEVQSNMQSALDELAEELKNNKRAKIKIEAYAGTNLDDDTTSNRVSLSRVLALRAYFIDAGVDTERVNVASMGNKSGRGPAERADITVE